MEAHKEWQAPTSFKEYIHELRDAIATIYYTFKLADSKDARPLMWKKYVLAFLHIVLGVIFSRCVAYALESVINKDIELKNLWISTIAIIFLSQKLLGFNMWRAHEYLFGIGGGNIRARVLEKSYALSPGQHKHNRGLNHESLIKGMSRAHELYDNHLRDLFETVTNIGLSYVCILVISPFSGVVLGLAILVHGFSTLYVNYKLLRITTPIERDFTKFDRYYAEMLNHFPRVYVAAKKEAEVERMRNKWQDVATRDRMAYVGHGKRVTTQDCMTVLALVVVMYHALTTAISGDFPIPLLYPLFAWSIKLSSELDRLRGVERNVYKCVASVSVLKDTLETPPDVIERAGAVEFISGEPLELEFEDVSYAYPGASDTVSNLSLVVRPGEVVALVGPSGAGKSTTNYLPLRFMDPSNGRVLVNKEDIRNFTIKSVLEKIGYIPQDPIIFDGTVRDNLLYNLPADKLPLWPDKRLFELMSDLAIDFGVQEKNQNPLDIVVGRDGVRLSGGQAQRLAIGSVVICEPKLMIVDEATSALDTATETQLLCGLRKWIDGAGMLVIAHRLATVRDANTIIVLNNGQIEATGKSFDELVGTSPTFRRLVSGQSHLLS